MGLSMLDIYRQAGYTFAGILQGFFGSCSEQRVGFNGLNSSFQLYGPVFTACLIGMGGKAGRLSVVC